MDAYGNLLVDHTRARLLKALTPRYLRDKLALVLYERRHPDLPWLTRDAIERLERQLRPEDLGFEWGSGVGSLWLARRSRSLVSVEHDPRWHARIRRRCEAASIQNLDCRLVAESAYLDVIAEFADAHFDYVLVDGLFRDAAFLASIPKVRPGGWIIFDNVNRYLPSESRTPHSRSRRDGPASAQFAEVAARVSGWRSIWTTNGVNDTAIFVKPVATG
jgi:hypothetical protein